MPINPCQCLQALSTPSSLCLLPSVSTYLSVSFQVCLHAKVKWAKSESCACLLICHLCRMSSTFSPTIFAVVTDCSKSKMKTRSVWYFDLITILIHYLNYLSIDLDTDTDIATTMAKSYNTNRGETEDQDLH